VYVDDDEEDRNFFCEVLEEINRDVTLSLFENGYDLIEFLQNIDDHHQLPCSIICDMQMPMLQGVDLLKFLKKEPRWRHIPVVIFSTSTSTVDYNISIESGATAFFSKPHTLSELKGTLAEILNLCNKVISIRL
jgi:CheY-like chemotaxis protein